jgi:Cdc6-like AAA superfamily ATPase
MSTFEKEQYDKALNALGVRRDKDPFPLDPPASVDYWADNKEVLGKMISTQLDSVMFASSFIYLLYGPAGGGKTFAIRYFENSEVQKTIFKTINKTLTETYNFRVTAIVPTRAGQLTFSLYKNIAITCLAKIRDNQELLKIFAKWKDFGEGCIKKAFKDIVSNIYRPVNQDWTIKNLEETEGYKLLTLSNSKLGKLSDVNDLVEVTRILVYVLSQKYARVVISIDELENLSKATSTERSLFSDFFRKLHENIEHDLTLFLIFTLDSYTDVADLLQKAFLTRIKDTIEFSYVKTSATVREYIYECISKRCEVDPYDIITDDAIYQIAESLITNFKGDLTFRKINTEITRIFTSAYIMANQPEKFKIDADLYGKINKITLSDAVMRQLTEQTKQVKGEPK